MVPVTWVAACCLVRELPLATFNIEDYADFVEREGLELVHEDTRRGMSRGTNHSTPGVTKDAERELKAQVERRRASAITTSTGLRRRERRFESCRGHHL